MRTIFGLGEGKKRRIYEDKPATELREGAAALPEATESLAAITRADATAPRRARGCETGLRKEAVDARLKRLVVRHKTVVPEIWNEFVPAKHRDSTFGPG